MESIGKRKCHRRSFTPEFKTEIVELCRRGDRTVGQVAKDLDLTETAVRASVAQAQVDTGERDGLTSAEREGCRRCGGRTAGCLRMSTSSSGPRFHRPGDPVSVHPFIEAEKQGGRNVKRACELLGVSRSAFYSRRQAVPGPRAMRDARLSERVVEVHLRSGEPMAPSEFTRS